MGGSRAEAAEGNHVPQSLRDLSDELQTRFPGARLAPRGYRFLGQAVRLVGNDAESAERVDAMVREFRTDALPPDPAFTLYVLKDACAGAATRYYTVDPGFNSFLCEDLSHLVSFWAAQLMRNHLYRAGYLLLHAAALDTGGKVCIFAGDAGCGKSTLVMRLAREGCGFFSDEVAPLDLARGALHPFPRSLLLRPDWQALPGWETVPAPPRAAVLLDYQERLPDGTAPERWVVPPSDFGFRVERHPRGIDAIFFIAGRSPDGTRVASCEAPLALKMLLDHAMNSGYIGRDTPEAAVDGLESLLESVPAARVQLGPLTESPRVLRDALTRAASDLRPSGLHDLRRVAEACRRRFGEQRAAGPEEP